MSGMANLWNRSHVQDAVAIHVNVKSHRHSLALYVANGLACARKILAPNVVSVHVYVKRRLKLCWLMAKSATFST